MGNWYFNKYGTRCDCGRTPLIIRRRSIITGEGYDWEDELSFFDCPMCWIGSQLYHLKKAIKVRIKAINNIQKILPNAPLKKKLQYYRLLIR